MNDTSLPQLFDSPSLLPSNQVASPVCPLDRSDNVCCSPVREGFGRKRDDTAREMCLFGLEKHTCTNPEGAIRLVLWR